MNNIWVRIFGKIKDYIDSIITILTTTGSEPAAYASDTIENVNKGLYDELASLGQFITFPVSTEYHTVYEAKRFELQEYATSGGNSYPYTYTPYPFSYNGELAILYRVATTFNSFSSYVYFYSDSSYISIQNTITAITYVEYSGGLKVYGFTSDPNTGFTTYYKQSYDTNWESILVESLTEPYYGGNSRFMNYRESVMPASGGSYYRNITRPTNVIVGEFPISYYSKYINTPQKTDSGWVWSCFDKVIFTDDDYLTTRMIQFNDPMLIGHSIVFKEVSNKVFYLTDIYRLYIDGRIERFKID
jgi:hypothetical protein